MQRRTILKHAFSTATLSFSGLSALAQSSAQDEKTRLLVIMARGGMDGLTAVPPVADPLLASIRPGILVHQPLRLTDSFGLHPKMQNLHDLWQKDQLKIVHCTGFSYTGRSHFEGQDVMQSGIMKPYAGRTGWMGRALKEAKLHGGIAISIPMPLLLKGDDQAETEFPNWMQPTQKDSLAGVMAMWSSNDVLAGYAQALQTSKKRPDPQPTGMSETADIGNNYGDLARLAAVRMKDPLGPRVAVVDIANGFDTHGLQGSDEGIHASRLRDIDHIIGSFQQEMGTQWQNSLVLTITEFGRTAAENGTNGTDHGLGSCCFLAGGLVKRSAVIADWRGLKKENLFEGRDLPVTIDACAIYAQVLERMFKLRPQVIQESVIAHQTNPLLSTLWT
jgi:uncharacterized protein (DUF1501 family)